MAIKRALHHPQSSPMLPLGGQSLQISPPDTRIIWLRACPECDEVPVARARGPLAGPTHVCGGANQ